VGWIWWGNEGGDGYVQVTVGMMMMMMMMMMMDEVLLAEAAAKHLSYAAADYGLGERACGEARRAGGERECESGSQYVPCTKPVPEME